MQRFWETAEIEPVAAGWRIVLDGRPVHIPGGAELHLPGRALAAAVAAEWQAAGGRKGGRTSYAELPLTRIAGTGQVRIAPDPEPVVLELARYGETDLLCYRAAQPAALVERQARRWQPWLDWAAARYGARLTVTTGVVHVPQPAEALAALAAALSALGPMGLAALGVAVPALGSLVLGLALAEGALAAAEAHALATLDETFQEEFWGTDEEALARRRRIGEDIAVAAHFLELLRA
jgi:chaperone required for assembly of F1-ATPase